MKTKILMIALAFLTTCFFISHPCYSQKWGGAKPTGLLNSWSVNINGGLTSYFGDLSLHDINIGAKLKSESGPALSLILTKSIFKDVIGLSGQILTGTLEGRKDNISFTAEFFEYNVQARIDFVDIFLLKRSHAFGIVGYTGAGQFLFKTTKVVVEERGAEYTEHDARVPEFVFFFGAGMYYKVNSNFGITADLALRQCQNDRLDDYVKNDDYDYYSYVSIGLSYYINAFKRTPLKNKARLANSSFRFRSPAHPAHDSFTD